MSQRHEEAIEWADRIEGAMRAEGMWSGDPLPAEAYEFSEAFAQDTMAYSQWLQFVFLPRVREIAAEGGSFPSSSMVGAQAVREFDGRHELADLVSELCAFDAWIEHR